MGVKKKVLLYSAATLFLTLIIVFFVFEFRFVKQVVGRNGANVTRIVSSELSVYLHGLQYRTAHAAQQLGTPAAGGPAGVRELAARNPEMTDVVLVDAQGHVWAALNEDEIGGIRALPQPLATVVRGDLVVGLAFAAPLPDGAGHLIIEYGTSDFQNEFLLKYAPETFKVGVLDENGRPLVWPFEQQALAAFNPERDTMRVDDMVYRMHTAGLQDFPFTVAFLEPESNFDTYRILTIMLLVFALYFLIYQFIVELLQLSSVEHYFDNINFNIFNNLKEGIIIANKFGKVLFANKPVYEMFAEKNIVPKETDLGQITGPPDGPPRVTLQKSGELLEIIRSPLVKNGKHLGSMVVISPSWEQENISGHALAGLVEMLPEGVLFVNKENKVTAFNMMAAYYLGRLAPDMNIGTVNAELADLIDINVGAASSTRVRLSWADMQCELKPVYDENRMYIGTIVFIKSD